MNDPRHFSEQIRKAQRTARQFIVDATRWLVYELPPPSFDRRMTSTLVFESDEVIRKVRNFPNNWRDLSDDELFALSWSV